MAVIAVSAEFGTERMRDRIGAHFKPTLLEFFKSEHPGVFRLDGLVDADKVIHAVFHSGSATQRVQLVECVMRYLVATDINAWQRLRVVEKEYLSERELQAARKMSKMLMSAPGASSLVPRHRPQDTLSRAGRPPSGSPLQPPSVPRGGAAETAGDMRRGSARRASVGLNNLVHRRSSCTGIEAQSATALASGRAQYYWGLVRESLAMQQMAKQELSTLRKQMIQGQERIGALLVMQEDLVKGALEILNHGLRLEHVNAFMKRYGNEIKHRLDTTNTAEKVEVRGSKT